MKKTYTIFLLFSQILIFSQNITQFNKIYNKVFFETAQKNFPAAVKTADSLLKISKTPTLQTKSLMLTANLYFQIGDLENSVQTALKAKKIIHSADDYVTECKVNGFLASLYGNLKLYDQSEDYLNECIQLSDKIEDEEVKNGIKGLIYKEKADLETTSKNFDRSIKYLQKSQKYYSLVKNTLPFHLAYIEVGLGQNYRLLKKYEESITHYENAIKIAKAIPDSYLNGFIYSGLAMTYIKLKDAKTAKTYLDLAQKVSDQSKFLDLKEDVNNTLEQYYTLTKDVDGLIKIKNENQAVTDKLQGEKSTFVDKSLGKLKVENGRAKDAISTSNIIIITILILLIFGIIYVCLMRKRQADNLQKFNKIMRDLNQKLDEQEKQLKFRNNLSAEINTSKNGGSSKCIPEKVMMESTELKLLKKLQNFENSTMFTKNTISLSTLSTYCNTNTRYLSHLINTHKKKDFHNYINELRIKYIIEKLEEIPKYRKYKISALAEETGFSSSNKFATIFKKETGISPSIFIKYLDEKNNS